jgi:hypothetical protein
VPALLETQERFLAAVLGRDPGAAAPWPRRRLSVYRVNARENFAGALEAAFPLLHGLMGHDEFRSMSWAYQRACPSRSGNLFHCGERLPEFLTRHLAGTGDAPLAVVAEFEWLIQQVLVAADGSAVRLWQSSLPLFALWEQYQRSGLVARLAASVAGQVESLLIRRAADGVELQRLTSTQGSHS